MFGKIIAFLVLAVAAVLGAPCGYCGGCLTNGLYGYGAGYIDAGCASSRVFGGLLGVNEVVPTLVTPAIATGVCGTGLGCGYGTFIGGCRAGIITAY